MITMVRTSSRRMKRKTVQCLRHSEKLGVLKHLYLEQKKPNDLNQKGYVSANCTAAIISTKEQPMVDIAGHANTDTKQK